MLSWFAVWHILTSAYVVTASGQRLLFEFPCFLSKRACYAKRVKRHHVSGEADFLGLEPCSQLSAVSSSYLLYLLCVSLDLSISWIGLTNLTVFCCKICLGLIYFLCLSSGFGLHEPIR